MTDEGSHADILIVGASAPELIGIRDHFGTSFEGVVRGLTVQTKLIGYGPAVAASGTARAIAMLSPRAVVLVGTAGVFPGLEPLVPGLGPYQPYDVLVATKVSTLDHAERRGEAEWPTAMPTSFEPSLVIATAIAAGRHRFFTAPIASPMTLTRSDEQAAQAARSGVGHAESTEAYGVAAAAVGADVPFACVLGVSHLVGSTGRADAPRFQRAAASKAAAGAIGWLQAGALGLPFQ